MHDDAESVIGSFAGAMFWRVCVVARVANNLTRSKIEANRKILSLVKPFQNCVQDGLFAAASGGGRRHRELLDTL